MENKVGGFIIGTIVATFVGCIFLVSTMTGFLPYHEQTKQAQIWANAQVEIVESNNATQLAIEEVKADVTKGTDTNYIFSNIITDLLWMIGGLFILFLVGVIREVKRMTS